MLGLLRGVACSGCVLFSPSCARPGVGQSFREELLWRSWLPWRLLVGLQVATSWNPVSGALTSQQVHVWPLDLCLLTLELESGERGPCCSVGGGGLCPGGEAPAARAGAGTVGAAGSACHPVRLPVGLPVLTEKAACLWGPCTAPSALPAGLFSVPISVVFPRGGREPCLRFQSSGRLLEQQLLLAENVMQTETCGGVRGPVGCVLVTEGALWF